MSKIRKVPHARALGERWETGSCVPFQNDEPPAVLPGDNEASLIHRRKLFRAEAIKEVRTRAGWTQATLAQFMGVAEPTLRDWERFPKSGHGAPGWVMPRLSALATFLDLRDELVAEGKWEVDDADPYASIMYQTALLGNCLDCDPLTALVGALGKAEVYRLTRKIEQSRAFERLRRRVK